MGDPQVRSGHKWIIFTAHMWWEEFEKQLNQVFHTYERNEGQVVQSNDIKLRILMSKIKVDFLATDQLTLTSQMSRIPMTLTYEDAVVTFRNAVLAKFPPDFLSQVSNCSQRHISEARTMAEAMEAGETALDVVVTGLGMSWRTRQLHAHQNAPRRDHYMMMAAFHTTQCIGFFQIFFAPFAHKTQNAWIVPAWSIINDEMAGSNKKWRCVTCLSHTMVYCRIMLLLLAS